MRIQTESPNPVRSSSPTPAQAPAADAFEAPTVVQRAPSAPALAVAPPLKVSVAMKSSQSDDAMGEDPNAWLEDVTGDAALAWVRARNAETLGNMEGAPFVALRDQLRAVMDSKEKIPFVSKHVDLWYNFWKDAEHPRGVWRRTTLEEYRKAAPQWETLLDIDALGKAEGKNWVFHGATYLEPACERCMVALSAGGSDATVKREFDTTTKTFVKDGFTLPEAKSNVSWIDANTLFVGTDMGEGSMTSSGYPRTVRRWTRGTRLEDAPVVFEGQVSDVSVGAYHDPTVGFERDFFTRSPTFFTSETFYLDPTTGAARKIEVPDDAEPSVHRKWLVVHLRTPWTVGGKTYGAGELIAADFDAFMDGERNFVSLFVPTATASLSSFSWTRDQLIVNVLDDVKSRVHVLTPKPRGAWEKGAVPGAPSMGTVSVSAVDPETGNDFFMTVEDYLTPSSLFLGTLGGACEKLKSTPAFFDASKCTVSQHFVASKDGTRVPYFVVAPKDLVLDGTCPTLLSGYGGFEVSNVPYYSGVIGRAWLENKGVYVVANIRGGGEYGPQWHEAALKANRHRCYEDFAAVAEDLVRRKITSPKHLGIQGGSNGGLLMGNMMTQYPALFGAVVCEVPLLDMKRYSHLLAGASWMGEYGDPDKPEEWAFIKTFSPYHNLKQGVTYPPTLFMTSTRDDRVHPGHARKMMEKMRNMGCDVHYYENIEGGHGGAADNLQAATMRSLAFTFLARRLA